MIQAKTMLKPVQVANIFETIFIEQMGVTPSKIGLDKNLYNDVGIDSLDCVGIVMELERKLEIRIPDKVSRTLTYATLHEMLDKCVQVLVADKRLNVADALIVKNQYANLVSGKTSNIKGNKQAVAQTNQKSLNNVPKELLDEYKKAVSHVQELENKIQQYQK